MFSLCIFFTLGLFLGVVAPLPQQNTNTTGINGQTGGADGASGPFKASFTRYGTGDIMGSQNCVTSSNACGVPGSGGPTAAVSENLFGVTGGAGAGPACGGCWSLTTDGGASLVVKVNNLCPIKGNELCKMQTLQDVNKEGANVHFDLCSDSGAADSLLGSGVGFGMGNAVKTSC